MSNDKRDAFDILMDAIQNGRKTVPQMTARGEKLFGAVGEQPVDLDVPLAARYPDIGFPNTEEMKSIFGDFKFRKFASEAPKTWEFVTEDGTSVKHCQGARATLFAQLQAIKIVDELSAWCDEVTGIILNQSEADVIADIIEPIAREQRRCLNVLIAAVKAGEQ